MVALLVNSAAIVLHCKNTKNSNLFKMGFIIIKILNS